MMFTVPIRNVQPRKYFKDLSSFFFKAQNAAFSDKNQHRMHNVVFVPIFTE